MMHDASRCWPWAKKVAISIQKQYSCQYNDIVTRHCSQYLERPISSNHWREEWSQNTFGCERSALASYTPWSDRTYSSFRPIIYSGVDWTHFNRGPMIFHIMCRRPLGILTRWVRILLLLLFAMSMFGWMGGLARDALLLTTPTISICFTMSTNPNRFASGGNRKMR